MKRLLCLPLLALILAAQGGPGVPFTIADITGDASVHQLAASGTCRMLVLKTPSTNSAEFRVGDSSVSATQGIGIAAGGALTLPPLTFITGSATNGYMYDLTKIYYRGASNDKLQVVGWR